MTTPVADAMVLLPTGEFGPRRETTTDANGHFSFNDVAPGVYVIVASKDGHRAEATGGEMWRRVAKSPSRQTGYSPATLRLATQGAPALRRPPFCETGLVLHALAGG